MKKIILMMSVLAMAYGVQAQEHVPIEQARKSAKTVVDTTGDAVNSPAKVELDVDKPQIFKADKMGVLVIPIKELSEKTLEKLGKEMVPVGEIWMLKLVPQINGKSATEGQLSRITVNTGEKTFDLSFYQVGVQKNDKGAVEMVIYGKDKKALVTAPLDKNQATQEVPIEVDGRKQDDTTGILTLSVLGKYKAEFTVGIQE